MTKKGIPEHLIKLAKQLRRSQTDAEKLMWYLLRNRQLANAKFRRQHPIETYVAGFYCHEHQLVIELDGGQHFEDSGVEKDARRTARLNALGIEVLRFDNREVLTNIEGVLQRVYERVTGPHSGSKGFNGPHPGPLPGGEGGV